jgi:antitoxin MazE
MPPKTRTKHQGSRRQRRSAQGRIIKSTVKKWGNSAAVRIPAAVMEATHLNLNDAVSLREAHGRIIIEPVRQKAYKLEDLLKGITPENRHYEVDFGPPVGKEAW